MQSLGRIVLAVGDAAAVRATCCGVLHRGLSDQLISLREFGLRWHTVAPARAASSHHRAVVLDGRAVSAAWQAELTRDVRSIRASCGRPPGLGVVLVGSRPDSLIYVTRKKDACDRVGIYSDLHHLPDTISQCELERCVKDLCANPRVDGVLVQLPLPPHIDEEAIIEAMDPRKDVDGFHPLNMGRTLMRGRTARFIPCTPLGIMQLLDRSGVDCTGKNVVVMGDSNIVGMPLAMLFRDNGAATVTVIHRTSYLELFADATCGWRAEQRAAADACLPRIPGPLSSQAKGAAAAGTLQQQQAAAAAHPYEVSYSSRLREAYGAPPPAAAAAARSAAAAQAALQAAAAASPALEDLPSMTRTADILVVAVGYPHLVKRHWVKPGAVVIDVGINVVEEEWGHRHLHGTTAGVPRHNSGHAPAPSGRTHAAVPFHGHSTPSDNYDGGGAAAAQQDGQHAGHEHMGHAPWHGQHHPFHVVGDVDFEDVVGQASCITPVPGGVGPMTIAAVLYNTVQAARHALTDDGGASA